MRKMARFKTLPKSQKIFRIFNLCLMLAVMLAGTALAIYYHEIGDPNHRVSASLITIVVAFVPFLLEIIFRFRFNNVIFLAYQIYFIFAALLGAALNLYNITNWYDIPVHSLMGYVMCLVGMFILARIDKYQKFNAFTIALFCFFFSLSVELVWEIGEFTCDRLFGLTMQGTPVVNNDPLVVNTVQDLICNLSGACLFLIHYLLGKLTRLNLGIKAMEKELTTTTIGVSKTEEREAISQEQQPEKETEEQEIKEKSKKTTKKSAK